MKALHTMDGASKARLFYDLFPDEIPILLDDITAFCVDFAQRKEEYRKHWTNGLMSFDYWLALLRKPKDSLKNAILR